jgi:tetratricopeptide (TPR) repeat protein
MRPMRTLTVSTALLLLASSASARSVKWFQKGASAEISGTAEVPLYRGDPAEHRPLVRATFAGEKGHDALAVIDLADEWTKVPYRTARRMGLVPEETTIQGRYAQTVVIPSITVGDLVLRDVPAEVTADPVPVLGMAALPVATALVPSAGVVRFSADGPALVAAIGTPVPVRRQTAGKWKDGDAKVWGTGLSFSVEGAVSGRDGWLRIDTAASETAVTRAFEDPNQRRRGGVVHVRARGRIGDDELPESWAVRDESLTDKAEGFVGVLGYDQLYSADVALSPADGLLALAPTRDPQWQRAEDVRLELARAAHRAAGLPSGDERVDRPPKIGFDKGGEGVDPKGDPGDPSTQRLEAELAMALWDTGQLDAAIPHFLSAAEAAGDRCGPHMELGLKRLHWSGALQQQPFIVELIRQPLREAGELWDRWDALDPKTREDVRKGRSVADDVFRIPQDPRCLTAWGTLMAAYVAQGNTAASSAIYSDHYGKDPLVAYAQGLSLLEQGQPKVAEIPIREALSFQVREQGDIKLGLGRAQVDQGMVDPVHKLVREVPGLELDHGLAAAMIVLEWGQLLEEGKDTSADMASRLVSADPYWIPGQLVAAWKGVDESDATRLAAELVRQRGRDAGAMDIEVYQAVLMAIQGDGEGARKALRTLQKTRPPTPDLSAALALVASINGRPDRVRDNLIELRLRYPTLVFDSLGLPVPPPEGDEEG